VWDWGAAQWYGLTQCGAPSPALQRKTKEKSLLIKEVHLYLRYMTLKGINFKDICRFLITFCNYVIILSYQKYEKQ
jgi:hypothetical protein